MLSELRQMADSFVILRDGLVVANFRAADLPSDAAALEDLYFAALTT